MSYFWWLLANILLPLFLPFIPLALIHLAKNRNETHTMHTSMSAAVKDGQFCLTAIALSTASVYEVFSLVGAKPEELSFLATIQVFLGGMALLIYAFAISFPVEVDFSKKGIEWAKHYSYGAISLSICLAVGLLSCYSHFGVIEFERLEKIKKEKCIASCVPQNKGSSS
jgi:hypothetical protein